MRRDCIEIGLLGSRTVANCDRLRCFFNNRQRLVLLDAHRSNCMIILMKFAYVKLIFTLCYTCRNSCILFLLIFTCQLDLWEMFMTNLEMSDCIRRLMKEVICNLVNIRHAILTMYK